MKTKKAILAQTIAYYEPLLLRYAVIILRNQALAAQLVSEVLEAQYKYDGLLPSNYLRESLRENLLTSCRYHKKLLAFTSIPAVLTQQEVNLGGGSNNINSSA